ncbi:MAG: DUF2474 domain-containing protein [Janthinobacterium lividum]|jgi:hypothetical protein|uniref:DUF2474 domain-containing protein n=1 Tax=Pseudomonas TaxID=286 RepID=UPI001CFC3E18|nr:MULTISPECIES: DUF2474 domain-containing protein [Pseudomonas]
MVHKDVVTNEQAGETVQSPWYKRVGWLVLIYVGSVVALGLFAMLIRLFMTAAGMKSH